ncbi:MAG: bis-aminopropyl spermidine synthase family protein [Candidatus Heimdallarchaeota archaeon]|nr:bis-aminopropyl spermidine synthase family protein [Candidatus Heimdallarchaeota archaeon]
MEIWCYKIKPLILQRKEPNHDLEQKYVTLETLRNRIEKLVALNFLTNRRILTIGDADLTGVATVIFGQRKE